jgi:hypothetical protein
MPYRSSGSDHLAHDTDNIYSGQTVTNHEFPAAIQAASRTRKSNYHRAAARRVLTRIRLRAVKPLPR